jgi:hypothetical protein
MRRVWRVASRTRHGRPAALRVGHSAGAAAAACRAQAREDETARGARDATLQRDGDVAPPAAAAVALGGPLLTRGSPAAARTFRQQRLRCAAPRRPR